MKCKWTQYRDFKDSQSVTCAISFSKEQQLSTDKFFDLNRRRKPSNEFEQVLVGYVLERDIRKDSNEGAVWSFRPWSLLLGQGIDVQRTSLSYPFLLWKVTPTDCAQSLLTLPLPRVFSLYFNYFFFVLLKRHYDSHCVPNFTFLS